MKIYKEKEFTKKILDKEICDWCKKEIVYPEEYLQSDTELRYRKWYSMWGDSWFDDSSWRVDLCENCFGKLRKFLESQGVKIEELDY